MEGKTQHVKRKNGVTQHINHDRQVWVLYWKCKFFRWILGEGTGHLHTLSFYMNNILAITVLIVRVHLHGEMHGCFLYISEAGSQTLFLYSYFIHIKFTAIHIQCKILTSRGSTFTKHRLVDYKHGHTISWIINIYIYIYIYICWSID